MTKDATLTVAAATPTPTPTPTPVACANATWKRAKCYALGEGFDDETCQCTADTPVLVDVNGDGFRLTDAAGGVNFDLDADGVVQERRAWTAPGADDAFLFLDRNEDRKVNNGTELFGNVAPQASSAAPNGFAALAIYDEPLLGGNGDGSIDCHDAVYDSLRLWQDVNHNGISEPAELHTLQELGVTSISLDYREAGRRDQYGNEFRFRAKVNGNGASAAGRWAYDVFLRRAQ
ncbi:MAG TPA: hypothetical protein VF546_11645 [Pyrinomonadaceae bacterium]